MGTERRKTTLPANQPYPAAGGSRFGCRQSAFQEFFGKNCTFRGSCCRSLLSPNAVSAKRCRLDSLQTGGGSPLIKGNL